MMKSEIHKEWWQTFFDQDYIAVWGAGGKFAHTDREVDFLEKYIPLKKGHRVLDLCCGHGRHAVELAKRGYKVTGLDFSQYELGIAERKAGKLNLKIDFHRADARSFSLEKKFDVIVNLFTAFGYGAKSDDRKILQRVSEHLRSGGKFLIDTMSLPWLWRNFRPIDRKRLDAFRVWQMRNFDFAASVLHETMVVSNGRDKKMYKSMLRLYTLPELTTLLAGAGLKVINVFGSFGGKPYNFDSKRMIILAKKI